MCVADDDCGDGESCIGGVCAEPLLDECAETCGADQVCEAGECRPVVECSVNGECVEDQICLHGTCTYVGHCTEDEHCPGAMTCEDNACAGDPRPGPPSGGPRVCEINDDCAEGEFCFDGGCYVGVQCLEHAHCAPNNACFVAQCWDVG